MPAPRMRLRASDALLIVHVQRDFCSGGALSITGADEIIPTINDLIKQAIEAKALVIASRDWHPPDHSSFNAFGGIWPAHCVQGSDGAKFHAALRLPGDALIVTTGQTVDKDQYSAFDATGLANELRRRGVKRVLICGLTQDVCVRATALDAVEADSRRIFGCPRPGRLRPLMGRKLSRRWLAPASLWREASGLTARASRIAATSCRVTAKASVSWVS